MLARARTTAGRLISRVSRRDAIIVALAVVVVTTMVTIADAARSAADRHRQVQALVERVRGNGQELNAVTWEGLAAAFASGHEKLVLPPSVLSHGLSAWTDLSATLDQLERLDHGKHTEQLVRDASRVYNAGTSALGTAQRSLAAAMISANKLFRPALQRLNADAERAAEDQRRQSSEASDYANAAFVGSLAGGLLLLLLLGGHLQRARRKAAVAESRHAAERRSEERIRALVEHSSDAVCVIGSDLLVRWQSASVKRMLGYDAAAIVESSILEFVHPDDVTLLRQELGTGMRRGGSVTFGARFAHADGGWRDLEIIADNRLDEPAVGGIVLSMRDVTDRKALEDELRHQAFHDGLTGLANRALFEDRLVHAMAGSRRHRQRMAVLFIDLDDFKTINDSLGHVAGDTLLKAVAVRVARTVRPTDTAARLGGDEFGVLVEMVEAPDDALRVAKRILDALAPPIEVAGRELRVGASIGVALGDATSSSAEELLRNADTAMYAAKERGKGTIEFFEDGMYERVLNRLELTGELQAALENSEFEVEYQPIVDMTSGRIVAAETLVRWRHPTRGRLAPAYFIGLAEETGLIVPLGRWIVERACAQAREWHIAHPDQAPIAVSVNVSPRQIRDPQFRSAVADTLAATELDPATLILEITETVLADRPDVVAGQLDALKELGVRIAVDDFGTGYSALSRLQQFSIDILKIDRSFVDGIESDGDKAKLVQSIVALGGTLQLDVIAEGIELEAQVEQLLAMRSPLGQGFLFSHPVSAADIHAMLTNGVALGREPKPGTPALPL
jgi:diguanylate cyclase (GGDEF)-like protein/PAS domain S-box-containing protein